MMHSLNSTFQPERVKTTFILHHWSSTVGHSVIILFISEDVASSLTLAFNTNGLIFSHGSATITCGAIAANEWKHVAITLAQDGNTFEWQCFVDGQRVASVPNFPSIPVVARTNVYLGKSITRSSSSFTGQIDVFRMLSYAINSEDAVQLCEIYTHEGRQIQAPGYTSGPLVAYSFDYPPQAPQETTTGAQYNYYDWQLDGTVSRCYCRYCDRFGGRCRYLCDNLVLLCVWWSSLKGSKT